jgi:hypothetical protein
MAQDDNKCECTKWCGSDNCTRLNGKFHWDQKQKKIRHVKDLKLPEDDDD